MDVETVVGRNDTAFSLDLYINNRYTIRLGWLMSLPGITHGKVE